MHDIDDHKYPHPPPPPTQTQTQTQPSSLPSPPSNLDPQYPNPSSSSSIDPSLPLLPPPQQHHQPPPVIPPTTPAVEAHLIALGWPPHIAITTSIICASISYSTETQHPAIHLSALRRFPELAVVQDADRLDALGAIGIARAFTYGGAQGNRGASSLADAVGHFETKLLKLEGMMKTGEGKRMARARSERVSLFKEWWGEEMGVAGGGLLLGGDGGGAVVGDVEMGNEAAAAAAAGDAGAMDEEEEDPARQLMDAIDDVGEDGGGSSGEGSSSGDLA
ncbi:MAG: hypothetical protein ASARMPRED_005008 [Alectoria sarmentosa]|nr:MAG: hypothetical protein ASARMPRED_005008 [Alectoria sarmentosa]